MGLAFCCEFSWLGADVQATATAVVADAVAGASAVRPAIVDDSAAVDVGDVSDVGDRAVVVEVMPVPVAAEEADADVTEAVVDASVEANMGTPVAVMECVAATVVAPVRRRPESTVVGGSAPYAGHPVVAIGTPCPVAGRPEIVGIGSGRLIVFGEWWRSLCGVLILRV